MSEPVFKIKMPPPNLLEIVRGIPEEFCNALSAGMFEVVSDGVLFHVITERLDDVTPTVEKFDLLLMNQLATVYQAFGDYMGHVKHDPH